MASSAVKAYKDMTSKGSGVERYFLMREIRACLDAEENDPVKGRSTGV